MRKVIQQKSSRQKASGLIEGDQQYQLLFDLNPCPIYVFDEKTMQILDVNQAMVKLYGWSRAEFLRMSAEDIRPPEKIRQFRISVKQQFGSRASFLGEWQHWRKDGRLIDVEVTASSVRFRGRDARLVMVNDITARKLTERKLLAAEEHYRTVADFTNDWEFWQDPQGKFIHVSPSCERITGRTSAEFIADPNLYRRLIHPDDISRFDRHIRDAAKKHQPGKDEWRFRRSDGTYRWIEHACRPVFDERGQYRGIRGSNRDITDRKEAEQALARERDLLQSVLNSAGRAHLVYLDRNFNFVRVNETYAATCGYRPEEMIGKNHFALYPNAENEAIFRRVRNTGKPFEVRDKPFEFHGQPERGVTYWDWTLIPVKGADGQVTGLIFSLFETTARVQAEAALERTHNTLTEAQKIAHMGSFEYIAATRMTVWSEEEYRIYGRDPTEPSPSYNALLKKCIHPDDRALTHRTFTKAMQRRSVYELEHRIVRPDGSTRWVYNRAIPYFDKQGKLVRYVGTTLDITDRKQAEEILKRSESRFRSYFESSTCGIAITSPTTKWVDVNDRLCEMLGYSKKELAQRTWTELTHPDDLQLDLKLFKQVLTKKIDSYAIDKRFICKNGKVIWTSLSVRCVRLADGSVDYIVALLFDITARKRAEEALQRSEALYRAIGESIDYGIWVCEPNGRNTYASKSFLIMVGLTQEQCSNFGWGQVLHPDDAKRTITAWKKCVRTGGMWDIEHRFRGVDGQWHDVLARGIPVKDEQGKIICWAGINLDISRLKKAEQDLRDLAAELEQRVQERTAELQLTNSSLIRAIEQRHSLEQQILEISEREQRRIGHDLHDSLGQRLAALKFMSSRLARRLAKKNLPGAQAAEQIEKELQHALEETRDIARGLHPVRSDGESLMSALYEMAGNVTRLFKVRCQFSCTQPVLVHDHTVATNLYRIAQEAISNAIRHAGAKHVWIRLQQVHGLVRLIVDDDGRGLQPEPKHTTGLGLEIMRYRSSVIGAGLDISGRHNGGTRVTCSWTPTKPRKAH